MNRLFRSVSYISMAENDRFYTSITNIRVDHGEQAQCHMESIPDRGLTTGKA